MLPWYRSSWLIQITDNYLPLIDDTVKITHDSHFCVLRINEQPVVEGKNWDVVKKDGWFHTNFWGNTRRGRTFSAWTLSVSAVAPFVSLLLERYVEWCLKVSIDTLSFFITTAAHQSQAAMFVWSRWCWPVQDLPLQFIHEGVGWDGALGSGSVQARWPNWETDFFMNLALRTGTLSCWIRKETNTNCRDKAGRSHCVKYHCVLEHLDFHTLWLEGNSSLEVYKESPPIFGCMVYFEWATTLFYWV